MASKDEYYQRIITSLQADISSQNKAISDIKSSVARQQKEIEDIKSSQHPQHSPLYSKLTAADKSQPLQQAKKEFAAMIESRLEVLASHYATKREFDTLRTTITKTYLPTDAFTSYKKAQETRLKSIEEKLSRRFSIFSTNRISYNYNQTRKVSFNFKAIIQFFKNHDPQWLYSIFVCMSIWMLAIFLLSRIKTQ